MALTYAERAHGGASGAARDASATRRTRWSGRPAPLAELGLLVTMFLAYRFGRQLIAGHDTLAMANAGEVWHVERWLRLPDERAVQGWALHWPALLRAANWYYVGVHFPLTVTFLVWGWWKRPPEDYRWARRLLITLTAFAFVVHVLVPLAPPRMLGRLGFVDTMATIGPSAYEGGTATVANQFAAMPSLHVGWALLLAVVVIVTTSSRWRWVTLAHPVVTTLVVVTTANHYWLDAIAAVALLGLALLVTPRRPQVAIGRGTEPAVSADRAPRRRDTMADALPSAARAASSLDALVGRWGTGHRVLRGRRPSGLVPIGPVRCGRRAPAPGAAPGAARPSRPAARRTRPRAPPRRRPGRRRRRAGPGPPATARAGTPPW